MTQFAIGLILAIGAALLMIFDILPVGARIILGVMGIALIVTSGFRFLS